MSLRSELKTIIQNEKDNFRYCDLGKKAKLTERGIAYCLQGKRDSRIETMLEIVEAMGYTVKVEIKKKC